MGDIPVPVPTPADLLAQLQQQLATEEAQNADLAKKMARVRLEIVDLAKSIADSGQKSSAWEKALQATTLQRKDVVGYISLQLPLLEAAVKNKADILKAKKDGEQQLVTLGKGVDAALADELKRRQDLQKAHDATAKKQKAYDDLLGLAAANDLVLKDLAALRAAAEKARAANEFSHEYYWILIMEDVVAKLRLPSALEYASQLSTATSDLATASGDERLAKDDADAATFARQQAEKTLAEATTKTRELVAAGIQESDALPSGDVGVMGSAGTGDGGTDASAVTGDGAG